MAQKRVTIDKWYGGMSSDPSVGGVGSFYDGAGVEIRKDSKKVSLSGNYDQFGTPIYSSNSTIVGAIIDSNAYNLYATSNGKLGNINDGETKMVYSDNTYTSFRNMFRYYGPADYGVIIENNGILRWIYSANQKYLGAMSETSVVTNGQFSIDANWAKDGSWVIALDKATHTPGSITTMTQTLTVDNATKYIIHIESNCTTGSCVVSMGGTTIGTITSSGNNTTQTFTRTTTSTSEALTFTPSSDFSGWIDTAQAYKSYISLAISGSFTGDSVILSTPYFLYIANGNEVTQIDTTATTWVKNATNPVKIAQGYTIKGMSKIGDQINIYASDGSNGKQYIWDGISDKPEREITWYDKPITRVLNLNNVDYIVVSTVLRSSLYMVNGYQPELIAQSINIQNSYKDRFAFKGIYINSIETIGNKLLIPSDGGLYSFGNNNPGYPKALLKEYSWDGGEPMVSYYTENSGYNIYVFYRKGIKNYIRVMYQNVETNSSSNFSRYDPGYIRTLPFFGTGYSQRKASIGYKIGAKIPTGTYVNIYSRADDETGYANFYTNYSQSPITVMPTIGAIYTNGSNTYTVTAITQTNAVSTGSAIIHCTYTGNGTVNYSGTLTKTSGTGDGSIGYYRTNEFKLIRTLSNNTRGGQKFIFPESYNKIEWIVELVTTNSAYTPELYDFQYSFDEIEIN